MGTVETLGKRIKRLRNEAGLSIMGLSSRIGVSNQTIKDIEADRTEGGIKSLTALSEFFKISVQDLQSGGGQEPEPVDRPSLTTGRIPIRHYLKIPDEIVEMAAQFGPDHALWEGVKAVLKEAQRQSLNEQSSKKKA